MISLDYLQSERRICSYKINHKKEIILVIARITSWDPRESDNIYSLQVFLEHLNFLEVVSLLSLAELRGTYLPWKS